ncbi:hypothetical protein CHUAL_003905 [Chamberlinius hualienensis]
MSHHSNYFYEGQQHHLSKVLSSVLEQHYFLKKSINGSKMAVYQDGGHLEMKLKQCAIDGDHRQSPVIEQKITDGLPIDLSQRTNHNVANIYTDDFEMTLTDEDEGFHNGQSDSSEKFQHAIDEMENGKEEEMSDKPLNLSTSNVKGVRDVSPIISTCVSKESVSPNLLQKRIRLEAMVRCIRKYSIGDGPKYCNIANGSHHSCGASDTESDGDNVRIPMKRSLSCSAMTSAPVKGNLYRHRRKHTVPNRGGKVLNVEYGSSEIIHQRLFPVLRQQLLRSFDGLGDGNAVFHDSDTNSDDADELDEDSMSPLQRCSSAVIANEIESSESQPQYPSHWTTFTCYANILQSLQNSLPQSTQSLLMAANIDVTDNGDHSPRKAIDNSNDVNLASASVLQRKRAPRALTGKHVKQGTGASPATLLTLRQKIEQKLNQQHPSPKHSKSSININRVGNGSSTNLNGRTRSVAKKASKRKDRS